MRFMRLMIPKGYESAEPTALPTAELVAAMMKYNDELTKAGALLTADGLHPPAKATRVSFTGGTPIVTDGPFAETNEALGGYWIIQAASQEEAVDWARRCPAGDGDVTEVRQIQGSEDFPEEIQKLIG